MKEATLITRVASFYRLGLSTAYKSSNKMDQLLWKPFHFYIMNEI